MGNITTSAFSRNLIRILLDEKISMCELSHRIHKDSSYISKVINGTTNPPLSVFVDICNALGYSPAEVLSADSGARSEELEQLRIMLAGLSATELSALRHFLNGMKKSS